MRLVWGVDGAIADYVAAHFDVIAKRGWTGFHSAAGFADEDGNVFGGVVLSDYYLHDAGITIYLERPGLTRAALKELFSYAFETVGLMRLSAETSKKNRKSRSVLERLGFSLEGVRRRGWHDGVSDKCLYGLLKENCKWLEM